MGILSDIWETNLERPWQLPDPMLDAIRESGTALVPVTPTYSCDLCGDVFGTEDELNAHVWGSHRRQSQALRINGRVTVRRHVIVYEPLQELVLYVNDTPFDQGVLTISQPSGCPGSKSFALSSKLTVLHSLLPPGEYKEIRVDLHSPTGRTDGFVVQFEPQDNPDYTRLDRMVEELQNKVYADARSVDWEAERRRIDGSDLSERERQYVEGFYSYFYAYAMEERGTIESCKNAARLFEEVAGRLEPFHSPLSLMARHVIALKLGWYDLLPNPASRSIFAVAARFFNRPYLDAVGANSFILAISQRFAGRLTVEVRWRDRALGLPTDRQA